jgi:hypothetical protein
MTFEAGLIITATHQKNLQQFYHPNLKNVAEIVLTPTLYSNKYFKF